MKWIIVFICCVLAVEILFRSKPAGTLRYIASMLAKTTHVIANKRISDHWKEKILPAYAFIIFAGSLRLLATLVLIFSPFAAALCLSVLLDLAFYSFLSSPSGLAGTAAAAAVYSTARSRQRSRHA
ncbi:MAG: hypothetical protein ACLFUN_10370 [Desulfobacterales bacterium]